MNDGFKKRINQLKHMIDVKPRSVTAVKSFLYFSLTSFHFAHRIARAYALQVLHTFQDPRLDVTNVTGEILVRKKGEKVGTYARYRGVIRK